jgi:CRP/FNR family transcriptional regulator
LGKLTPSALQDFSSLEYLSAYPAKMALFTEGEPARGLFVVHDGEVLLSINSTDGRRLSMRIAKRGCVIGLSSTLCNTPYEQTAETLCSSKVAHIGRRAFLKFLDRHPEAHHAATEELGRDMTLACSQLRTVGFYFSASQRLARLLLEWSDDGLDADCGSHLHFSLTHEEIGDFVGTSRETVTRTLTSFKNRHLVVLKGSLMTIPSRAALADYACAS